MNLPFHVWIDSFTYAFSHLSLCTHESTFSRIYWLFDLCFLTHEPFTYEYTFSRMDWLSQLCFVTHEPFDLWIYLHTYGLTLSALLSHAWAFSPMNLPSHVWSDFLTSAFSSMSLFTYESNFSHMDWLSHLCFLTHEPSHLIYLFTYGLTLSLVLSMHEHFDLWIFFLTYGLTLSLMLSHAWAFFTSESAFPRMDCLSHLCFRTHEPFHLWIYFLTYWLTLSPMRSDAWDFSPMNLHSTFSRMNWLSHLCLFTHEPFHLWIYLLTYVWLMLLWLLRNE